MMQILENIRTYFVKKPERETLVRFSDHDKREDYSKRILQRLGIEVEQYSIINVHKIGIEVPGRYVFEELMKWDENSSYWPNGIARIKRISGELEDIEIYLFGLERLLPIGPFKGFSIPPLFCLKKLRFNQSPHTSDVDNARSLLYTCEGGYPIGIFSLYVRSSIAGQNEIEKTQLFSMVAFNFYGKKKWYYTYFINYIWEAIHNRVTANILNRLKFLFEEKFLRAIGESRPGVENRNKNYRWM